MSDLMVTREAVMEDVLVLSFTVLPPKTILVTFEARRGRWFDPDAPEADSDGWVRDLTDITGDIDFTFVRDEGHDDAIRTLEEWASNATLLIGFANVDRQAYGFIDPVTRKLVAVRMPPEALDRPA